MAKVEVSIGLTIGYSLTNLIMLLFFWWSLSYMNTLETALR